MWLKPFPHAIVSYFSLEDVEKNHGESFWKLCLFHWWFFSKHTERHAGAMTCQGTCFFFISLFTNCREIVAEASNPTISNWTWEIAVHLGFFLDHFFGISFSMLLRFRYALRYMKPEVPNPVVSSCPWNQNTTHSAGCIFFSAWLNVFSWWKKG